MSEEAGTVPIMSSRDDVVQNLSQKEEIITVDDHQHMSIDELLKVIKRANGMPVLFVPSSDGRLAAVAVDGLQNLVPTNREHKGCNCTDPRDEGSDEKKDFRAYLLLLMSLVATVTFTAGLTPPGGFWSADDKVNGYVAGNSVMQDKSPTRYRIFYYSNSTAFFASLMVIAMLAKNKRITVHNNKIFGVFVGLCLAGLGTSYIVGASSTAKQSIYVIALFVAIASYLALHWMLMLLVPIQEVRKKIATNLCR